jgi:TonB family protein
MHDPVADVLEERSSAGSGLSGAIALSLLLHAGGAGLAIYTAIRQPPSRPVTKLNIRFARAPRPAQPSPVTATPAAPTPVAPRIQEPTPAPIKAPPKKAPEAPAKNTVPMSPFGRSSKKGAEVPAPPPPPPAPASAAVGNEIGIGEAGVTGLEGGDFPYTLYLDRMKTLVGARWIRPQLAAGGKTVVYFQIQRDGTIRDAAIEIPSGNGTFDRAALRAVLETSPLPPLPFGYSGNYLGVHLTFR